MKNGTSMQEQLKTKVRPALLHSAIPPNPRQWKGDGVDHINISRFCATELGRMLDFDDAPKSLFRHPKLGSFRSINSLYYFLRSRDFDEALRTLVAHALRKYAHTRAGVSNQVPNLNAVVLDSAWQKLKTNQKTVRLMTESTLPFDSYHINREGIRQRFDTASWVAGGYEEMRKALKEDREPNFTPFQDKPGDLYEAVLTLLRPEPSDVPTPVFRKEKKNKPKGPRKEGLPYKAAAVVNIDAPVSAPTSVGAPEKAPLHPTHPLASANRVSQEDALELNRYFLMQGMAATVNPSASDQKTDTQPAEEVREAVERIDDPVVEAVEAEDGASLQAVVDTPVEAVELADEVSLDVKEEVKTELPQNDAEVVVAQSDETPLDGALRLLNERVALLNDCLARSIYGPLSLEVADNRELTKELFYETLNVSEAASTEEEKAAQVRKVHVFLNSQPDLISSAQSLKEQASAPLSEDTADRYGIGQARHVEIEVSGALFEHHAVNRTV